MTMDFQPRAEDKSREKSAGEEKKEDPRHDHHADLDELFGPHDPYYDPAAKLVARLLRLQHNVAYLQRQRGEVETERRINTSLTLYEQTHQLATLTRGVSLQRLQGLSQPPTLDWSDRLDDRFEQMLLDTIQTKIQALQEKVEELKPDSDPPISQSPATIARPVPQSVASSSRLSPSASAAPAASAHKVRQQTMGLQSGAESKDESEDEEQDEADPRHDHHADLDELFGPHDPCYDPAAKLAARVLRLMHNVAYLQRQRGEVETERRISTSQTLYEQTHQFATLTRGFILKRSQGLSQSPTLDWSYRLDDSAEQRLLDTIQTKIQALREKVAELQEL